jgi:hypothetical protein
MRVINSGPPPKDPSTRRRTNTPAAEKAGITELLAQPVKAPKKANPKWQSAVKDLYSSLATSGQSQDWQDSDWAFAWLLLDVLNIAITERNATTLQLSASLLTNVLSQLARLGVTVSDRKRIGLNLTRQTQDATITEIQAGYRKLQAVKDS